MKEKSTWLQWVGAVVIAALFFTLAFFIGRVSKECNSPEIPDSSKIESVIIQDNVETQKLKSITDSMKTEIKNLDRVITRKKSNISQILLDNEIKKQRVLSASDSAVVFILDSLLESKPIYFYWPNGRQPRHLDEFNGHND